MKYHMTPHARMRLHERFGLGSLPEGRFEFVKKMSVNRKMWRKGEIYCIIRKSDRKIITVLTERQAI